MFLSAKFCAVYLRMNCQIINDDNVKNTVIFLMEIILIEVSMKVKFDFLRKQNMCGESCISLHGWLFPI